MRSSWQRMLFASQNADSRAVWSYRPERYGVEVSRRGATMYRFRAEVYANAFVLSRPGTWRIQPYDTDLGERRFLVVRVPKVKRERKPKAIATSKPATVVLSNPWTGTRY